MNHFRTTIQIQALQSWKIIYTIFGMLHENCRSTPMLDQCGIEFIGGRQVVLITGYYGEYILKVISIWMTIHSTVLMSIHRDWHI